MLLKCKWLCLGYLVSQPDPLGDDPLLGSSLPRRESLTGAPATEEWKTEAVSLWLSCLKRQSAQDSPAASLLCSMWWWAGAFHPSSSGSALHLCWLWHRVSLPFSGTLWPIARISALAIPIKSKTRGPLCHAHFTWSKGPCDLSFSHCPCTSHTNWRFCTSCS